MLQKLLLCFKFVFLAIANTLKKAAWWACSTNILCCFFIKPLSLLCFISNAEVGKLWLDKKYWVNWITPSKFDYAYKVTVGLVYTVNQTLCNACGMLVHRMCENSKSPWNLQFSLSGTVLYLAIILCIHVSLYCLLLPVSCILNSYYCVACASEDII